MTNAVPYRQLLLLLDGHSTHFEPKSLELARKNQIIVFAYFLLLINLRRVYLLRRHGC